MNTCNNPENGQPHIVLGAGGGGGSAVGPGLIDALPNANVSVVVPTGDSGSKTGELRRLYGGPAVGDLRKNLSAVSGDEAAGALFGHRFDAEATADTVRELNEQFLGSIAARGIDSDRASVVLDAATGMSQELPRGLRGHTFGNLVLTALRSTHNGDLMSAVREASSWLDARAQIIPVTAESHDVVMHDAGQIIRGEGVIDERPIVDPRNAQVWLENHMGNSPQATQEAMDAIAGSQVFILGPGSLFTSLMPTIAPRGIAQALAKQEAGAGAFVSVANLVPEEQATQGLDPVAYISKLEKAAGRRFDRVFYNTGDVGAGKIPLRFDERQVGALGGRAIGANLVGRTTEVDPNDPIANLRSPVHHNAGALVRALLDNRVITLPELSTV